MPSIKVTKKKDVFQGPVRPGTSEEEFRATGKSVPLEKNISIGTPTPSPIKPTTTAQKVAEIMGTLPPSEKTTGFTQEMLDEARSQGIDVFDPHNLQKISKIEQGAQANLSAQEQAIANLMQKGVPPEVAQQTNLTNPNLFPEGSIPSKLTQAFTGQPNALRIGPAAQRALTVGVGAAAEIIDGIASVLLSKKGAKVTTAEAGLTDALSILNANIELVKSGLKPAYEVQRDFDLANESINRLQRTNTGIGKFNLRYWLDDGGKSTEIEVLQAQNTLKTLRLVLEQNIALSYQNAAAGAIV